MTGASGMKAWVVGGLIGMALVVSAPCVHADNGCRTDQRLSPIGSVRSTSGVISTAAAEVRLINVTCTTTACLVGLYDTTTLGLASNANVVIEPGAPASQTVLLPQDGFFENPLSFTTGIVVVTDANVSAVRLFECVQR